MADVVVAVIVLNYIGRVINHDIDNDFEANCVSFNYKLFKVIFSTQVRINGGEVQTPIAMIGR